jgi:hypothetical protein
MLGGDDHPGSLVMGVLTRRHWLLLWVGWALTAGALLARQLIPARSRGSRARWTSPRS